jgi:hypothetical protein
MPEIKYLYTFITHILAPAIGLSFVVDWISKGDTRMLNLFRQFVSQCPPLLGPGDDILPEHNTQLLEELQKTGLAEDLNPEVAHLVDYLSSLPDQVFSLVKAIWDTSKVEDLGKHEVLTDKLKPNLNSMDDEEYIELMSDVMAEMILSNQAP